MVSGFFHSLGGATANNVVRLERDGTRDPTFDSTGSGTSAYDIRTLLIRPSDGRIFLAGVFSTYGGAIRNSVAWATPDRAVDNTFADLPGVADFDPCVFALLTQADGKVIVGGLFDIFQGSPHYNIVRLNPDGTIDSTFSTQGTEGSLRAMLLQPDGKIVIAGNLRAVDGVAQGSVARLNPDGSLDVSFQRGSGTSYTVYALAQYSSGNIYLGGNFISFDGHPRVHLAKLTPNGSLDLGFDPGAGPTSTIYAIVPAEAEGRIVVGGTFSSYNGVSVKNLARIDALSGALDASFNTAGSGPSSTVHALLHGSNGEYYLGGSFASYNGTKRVGLARLNSNGSLDTGFDGPNLGQGGSVFSLTLQNGKLLAAGIFASPKNNLLRLLPDGSDDATFNPGTGPRVNPPDALAATFSFSALAVQPDGKLLLGGSFNQYNAASRTCLVRLTDANLEDLRITSVEHTDSSHILVAGIGSPNATYFLEAAPDLSLADFTLLANVTSDTNGVWHYSDTVTAEMAKRFYRLSRP